MSNILVFFNNGNFRKRPKEICIHRSQDRSWNSLDGRVGFLCKCDKCSSFPGLCIEDWRDKKIICNFYQVK